MVDHGKSMDLLGPLRCRSHRTGKHQAPGVLRVSVSGRGGYCRMGSFGKQDKSGYIVAKYLNFSQTSNLIRISMDFRIPNLEIK
jgi:hypothetical protein